MSEASSESSRPSQAPSFGVAAFRSETVDRVRAAGNVWSLPGGQLLLPDVFGFCRGVMRALRMLQDAVDRHGDDGKRIVLLGEIIHNPWVNEHFRRRGVRILTREQTLGLEQHVGVGDCAVVPAFGVPLEVQHRLESIGCEVVDTSCGDVRRVWRWAEQAVTTGHAVLIFGRALHDETVVTKSRLAAAGGKYLVVGSVDEARQFCRFITHEAPADAFAEMFGPEATNATDPTVFERLAQVSQTTMLFDETVAVRNVVREAFSRRFSPEYIEKRLLLQPTVCRATQNRQSSAMTLCAQRCDLAIVVGGFGSSNTRHLHELASTQVPAYLIEGAEAIRGKDELDSVDAAGLERLIIRDWLPERRPLRIAVLAGASCPEEVIGQVLERLAGFLS
jgi:4-hydroxy-3-methylbut-2-en-1-yl diphosphate reductase